MQMKIKDNLDSIWLCEMADISCVLKLNPMLLCSFYSLLVISRRQIYDQYIDNVFILL